MNIETMTCDVYEDGMGGLWAKGHSPEDGEWVRLEATKAALRARHYALDDDGAFDADTGLRCWVYCGVTEAQQRVVDALAACGFPAATRPEGSNVLAVGDDIQVYPSGIIRVRASSSLPSLTLSYAVAGGFRLDSINAFEGVRKPIAGKVQCAARWLFIARAVWLPPGDIDAILTHARAWVEALKAEHAANVAALEEHVPYIEGFTVEVAP